MSRVVNHVERSCFRYLRSTILPKSGRKPILQAFPNTLTVACQEIDRKSVRCWFLDCTFWWGDGIAGHYSRRRYRDSHVCDSISLGPYLHRHRPLSREAKVLGFHLLTQASLEWAKLLPEPLPFNAISVKPGQGPYASKRWWDWRQYSPKRRTMDALYRSELRYKWFRHVDYAYETVIETELPNQIGPRTLGKPYEVVGFLETDPLIQSNHLDRWLSRVFYVKHDDSEHLAGIDPTDDPNAVGTLSLVPGLPSERFDQVYGFPPPCNAILEDEKLHHARNTLAQRHGYLEIQRQFLKGYDGQSR